MHWSLQPSKIIFYNHKCRSIHIQMNIFHRSQSKWYWNIEEFELIHPIDLKDIDTNTSKDVVKASILRWNLLIQKKGRKKREAVIHNLIDFLPIEDCIRTNKEEVLAIGKASKMWHIHQTDKSQPHCKIIEILSKKKFNSKIIIFIYQKRGVQNITLKLTSLLTLTHKNPITQYNS